MKYVDELLHKLSSIRVLRSSCRDSIEGIFRVHLPEPEWEEVKDLLEKAKEMKFDREELEAIVRFIGVMKKHDPGSGWNVTLSEVMYDPDTTEFMPRVHIYINGKKVEAVKDLLVASGGLER